MRPHESQLLLQLRRGWRKKMLLSRMNSVVRASVCERKGMNGYGLEKNWYQKLTVFKIFHSLED